MSETDRPVIFRNGLVLTMDDTHTVLPGRRRAGRRRPDRRGRPRPDRARRRPRDRRHRRHPDARHGRHPPAHVADRHARVRRRLDPHPVLRLVLPRVRQAVPARGHLRRQPARRHRGDRRRCHHHRRLVARPADAPTTRTPPSTRWRRCRAGSSSPTATSSRARGSGPPPTAFRDFYRRRIDGGKLAGFQMAFDIPGDPAFPEKAAFEVARELGVAVTTHAGVWGATNDDGIRLMHENGFMTPETVYVHAATLIRRLVPADRRQRRLGLGLHRERAERRPGLPAHLAAAQARHPGVAVDGHQRVVERRPVLGDAHHAQRRSRPRAHGGAHQAGDGHPPPPARRAGRRLGAPGAAPRRSARTRRSARSPRAARPTSC